MGFHRQIYTFPIKKNDFLGKIICFAENTKDSSEKGSSPPQCLAQLQAFSWNKLLLGNVEIVRTPEWFFSQPTWSLGKFIYSN